MFTFRSASHPRQLPLCPKYTIAPRAWIEKWVRQSSACGLQEKTEGEKRDSEAGLAGQSTEARRLSDPRCQRGEQAARRAHVRWWAAAHGARGECAWIRGTAGDGYSYNYVYNHDEWAALIWAPGVSSCAPAPAAPRVQRWKTWRRQRPCRSFPPHGSPHKTSGRSAAAAPARGTRRTKPD